MTNLDETLVTAYPLAWPLARPRTKASDRKRARFGSRSYGSGTRELSLAQAAERLLGELQRMGVGDWNVTVSTNVTLRNDGLPRSGQKKPDDPGVAVYFKLDNEPVCMPCDCWDRVADNLAAIAATIAAKRGIERWGVGSLAEHFAGFKALPNPVGEGRHWRTVLGFDRDEAVTEEKIKHEYVRRVRQTHPDLSPDLTAEQAQKLTAELNRARDEALAGLEGR